MTRVGMLLVLGGLGLLAWWLGRAPAGRPAASPAIAEGRQAAVERADPGLSATAERAAVEPLAAPPPAAAPGGLVVLVNAELDDEGGPAADVALELGVATSPSTRGEPLAHVRTDAAGRARVELRAESLDVGAGRRAHVWVRSRGPGILSAPSRAVEAVPVDHDGELAVSLQVERGVFIEGLLLGADGRPVRGEVGSRLLLDEGRLLHDGSARAGDDGRFELAVRREGPHVIVAEGRSAPDADGDLGTAASAELSLRYGEPAPFLTLRVRGPGRLHGRVVDAGGAPAAGVRLQMSLAALHEGRASNGVHLELQGRGHGHRLTVTDAAGRFDVPGLRDDLYHVHAHDEGAYGYTRQLTERPVSSLGAELVLRLSRPHLAVHVREADGSAPAELEALRWARPRRFDQRWPSEPALAVSLAREHDGGAWQGARHPSVRRVGPGEFTVEVRPGTDYDLGVLGGAVPWQPVRVEVPARAGRVEVELVVPEPRPLGVVLLDVADAQGEPVYEKVRARVIDPATGVALLDDGFLFASKPEHWPRRLELPEGEYRFVVEGRMLLGMHGEAVRRRAHGHAEHTLRVVAGAEVPLRARLGAGAQLRLRLDGVVTEADRDAVRESAFGDAPDDFVDHWAPRAWVTLERAGRWPEAVPFVGEPLGTDFGNLVWSNRVVTAIPLGESRLSELLSPGAVTLVARLHGGREVRRELLLEGGRTLDVTLAFD